MCLCGCFLLGCDSKPAAAPRPALIVYTSVDEPIARQILADFGEQERIYIETRYDTEATKSVGLAERLRAEKANPQCDVWWGNEIFLTIGLANDGCLAPYDSPEAADVPAKFKDADKRWAASGMRVRVIAMRGQHSAAPDGFLKLKGLEGLTDPSLKDQIVMARPVAGTTTGHVAALYQVWGESKADAYFKALHANGVKLLGGNAMVPQAVGGGQAWAGLTDNDDVAAAVAQKLNVTALIPDQGDSGLGTLAIPCTVGLVAGRPASDPAKRLVDFLLSKEVEQKLIDAKFVKYSVRAPGDASTGSGQIRTMEVDYAKAAAIFPQATRRATALLEGREP